MKDYRKIQAWQRSHALTLEIYRLTKLFPKDEMFGLTSQMRRASSSIPANIAEGAGRDGDAELKRFLIIALGSASELDYFILLSGELGYIEPSSARKVTGEILEIRRMLGGFIQKLKA
ncbi:four helix bundle protein [Opitutus sp. GAS368]|uniref:four helix bundle protein n=1 Tax=Opitutus sp. GAS368 TaxID=1882749 RepID=UPI00087C538B|nr:four helix bundle protein [Opitutus sp. GAS368]SDS65820.1 four helix bundle protein [Opitutus sp. GAS368]